MNASISGVRYSDALPKGEQIIIRVYHAKFFLAPGFAEAENPVFKYKKENEALLITSKQRTTFFAPGGERIVN